MPRLALLLVAAFISVLTVTAEAAMRVGQVCTLEGQREIRLEGVGLVVGLNGTGDGGDNPTTMQHFAQYAALNGIPVKSLADLKKHGNSVALVHVSATIPATGVSRGQRLDAQVSVLMGCKSLAGGRLILTPLGAESLANNRSVGEVEGSITVEDKVLPTTGRISNGLIMQETVEMKILRRERQVRLLIKKQHSGLSMAREIERAINDRFYLEANNKQIARSASASAVDVNIPEQYDNPIEFGALLEEVVLKEMTSRPRVVVNAKSGTIVVTGDVEISPAVISHRSLTVDTTERFVPLQDAARKQNTQQLSDLVEALNRLRVPTQDMIEILRSLSESGRLHAEFITE